MADTWTLIADIGGTNARFAACQGDRVIDTKAYETEPGQSLLSLALRYCSSRQSPPDIAVLAVAGPVEGNAAHLTNTGHRLNGDDLRDAIGARKVHIINDFAAAAWAVSDVDPSELGVICGSARPGSGTRLVIGPGTGLGVGAISPIHGGLHAIVGEGGHAGIGPRTREDADVFEALRNLWPEAFFGQTLTLEAEAILSGTGLPMMYRAVQSVRGKPHTDMTPQAIFTTARAGSDPEAVRVVSIFKTYLAQLAGDLGLSFGATGGVFLVGGIAQKNPWLFDAEFVDRLRSGGRFTRHRSALDVYLLQRPDFGLMGAQSYAALMAAQGRGD